MLSIHSGVAAIASVPEMELDQKEAADFARALADVQRFYPIGIDEKTLAWGNLAMVAGGIYGTRFAAYRIRKKREAEEKKRPQPSATVHPISSLPGGSLPDFKPAERK